MLTPLYMAMVLAQASLGGTGHHGFQGSGCCDVCGVESAWVAAELGQLQAAPRRRDRKRAARQLRTVDWHCHPEVVDALAAALLKDCDDDVRGAAAESLRKLAACTPTAHEALQAAATCDPDWCVRHDARKALKAFRARCSGPCQVCGPGTAGAVVPLDGPEPEILLPPLVPPATVPDGAVVPSPPAASEPGLTPIPDGVAPLPGETSELAPIPNSPPAPPTSVTPGRPSPEPPLLVPPQPMPEPPLDLPSTRSGSPSSASLDRRLVPISRPRRPLLGRLRRLNPATILLGRPGPRDEDLPRPPGRSAQRERDLRDY